MLTDGLTPNQRYYRKNKAVMAARLVRWLANNPGKGAEASRRAYASHAEARRAYARTRYQETRQVPALEQRRRDRTRVNMQNRRNAGKVTAGEWNAILESHGNFCHWCKADGIRLEMDHVTPISRGGLHEAGNIVPACRPCNASRGNRYSSPPRLQEAA